jgi:hypothetical protein
MAVQPRLLPSKRRLYCHVHPTKFARSSVKAFMGIAAEQFWELVQQMTDTFADRIQQQRQRADCRRAVAGGRAYALPLAIRPALV